MKEKRIPLLPRHKIYLPAFGYGDDEKFARVFRDTWPRLPLHVRRVLLKHWRETKLHPDLRAPAIEVLPDWSRPAGRKFNNVYGMYADDGLHEIRFWAPAVDLMPDEQLSALIAHELAHVYARAARLWFTDRSQVNEDEEEKETAS
jgi:Zn-dependent protease with chaperone function